MTNLQQTLFIFKKCYWNIHIVWNAIEEHQEKGPIFSLHHFTKNLTHYLILETASFLDEYRKRFNHREVEDEFKEE